MNKNEIWQAVDSELRRAKKKHPGWPDHIVACAGIVCEESGELIRACINKKYEKGATAHEQDLQNDEIKREAVHVIATAIRFLENIK